MSHSTGIACRVEPEYALKGGVEKLCQVRGFGEVRAAKVLAAAEALSAGDTVVNQVRDGAKKAASQVKAGAKKAAKATGKAAKEAKKLRSLPGQPKEKPKRLPELL